MTSRRISYRIAAYNIRATTGFSKRNHGLLGESRRNQQRKICRPRNSAFANMRAAFGVIHTAFRAFFKIVRHSFLFLLFGFLVMRGLFWLLLPGNLILAGKQLEALPYHHNDQCGKKDFRQTQHGISINLKSELFGKVKLASKSVNDLLPPLMYIQ